jgi:hypothetical protein
MTPMVKRTVAAGIAVIAGVAAGLALADGQAFDVAAAAVLGSCVALVAAKIAPTEARGRVVVIALTAFVLRAAVAVVLHDALLARGGDGTLGGDDAGYYNVSWGIADWFHGGTEAFCRPPTWCGGSYLFGTFVYLQAIVFFFFGRDLLLIELVNAAFGAALVAIAWDIGRRLFDGRAALATAVAIAVYPGLVLFSAIDVKDPLGLLLTAIVLWALLRFAQAPRWTTLAVALIALEPLHGLRQYVFFGLAVLIPVAVVVAPGIRLRRLRVRWLAAAVLASGGLMVFNVAVSGNSPFTDKPLVVLEYVRTAMDRGRTGFSGTPPGPSGAQGPSASASPRASPTAPPSGELPIPDEGSLVLNRTIEHLPVGIAYVLFAPFPWQIDRTIDALVLPDTLMWYVLLVAAAFSVRSWRMRWRLLAPIVTYVVGLMGLFSLVEGNVGTLYRHRAVTVVAFVAVLAGPALGPWVTRLGTSLGPSRRR